MPHLPLTCGSPRLSSPRMRPTPPSRRLGVGLAQGVVVEGTAVSAVTLVTLEAEADLVVVSSQGVDSLLGRIFGAVSVQVLRKAQCDVLVVVP